MRGKKGAMEPRPKAALSGKQRRHLRGLAHHLDPIVRVGHEGVDDGIVGAVNQALIDHELIKVKVLENCPEGRREVSDALVERCGAHPVGQLGRIVILYRRHPDKPQISLPR